MDRVLKLELDIKSILSNYEKQKRYIQREFSYNNEIDFRQAPVHFIFLMEYLIELKTLLNIKKIILEYIPKCGIYDYATVYRCFKKFLYISPKEFSTILMCLDIVDFIKQKQTGDMKLRNLMGWIGFKTEYGLQVFLKNNFHCCYSSLLKKIYFDYGIV